MLPARSRLRRTADFRATTRGGRRNGTATLVVHVRFADPSGEPAAPGGGGEPARAGFVVSRTVGPAVMRNRVRRRLRHLVAARLDAVPAGARIVVRALPAAAGADSATLGADLDRVLAKLGGRVPRQPLSLLPSTATGGASC